MTPRTVFRRLRRAASDAKILMKYGNHLPSLQFFAGSILRRKMPVRVNLEAVSVVIRSETHDLGVALSCLRDGEFDSAICASRPKHQLIVDAGGYIGTAAIAFARAFPDSTIVTLEPSAINFAVLTENVRPYKNIIPLNKALANHDGPVELFNRGSGEWGFTTIKQPANGAVATVIDQIQCISLPTLLKDLGRSGIDILKLDIEGGEKTLLEGDTEWINSVEIVIAELHERIASGCTRAFYRATDSMKDVYCGGEKVMVVRH